MDLYLPIAGLSVNIFALLALGASVGFLSGLFGIGGGFLVTPLLAFLGVPPTIAVGTQACQLAGTSLSGALAHARRGHIDFRMGFVLTVAGFGGALTGVQTLKLLKAIGQVDLAIMLCYVTLLSIIGTLMFFESAPRLLKSRQRVRKSAGSGGHGERLAADPEALTEGWGAQSSLAIEFPDSQLRVNILLPIGLGFFGGILVSLLGIGGFVMVPAMIYILRMRPSVVNGTSLFQMFFSAVATTVMQAAVNHSVDIVLAVVLMVGSTSAAPLGAKVASRLSPVWARFLLALLLLAVAGKLLYDLFVTPDQLFTVDRIVGA